MTTTNSNNTYIKVGTDDQITRPLQPSVGAALSVEKSNVTGDGTNYSPVVLGLELHDCGSNFAANTFTAPVSGKYLVCFSTYMIGITSSHTKVDVRLTASNGTLHGRRSAPSKVYGITNQVGYGVAGIIDMDAADTLVAGVTVSNGTKVVDLRYLNDFGLLTGLYVSMVC